MAGVAVQFTGDASKLEREILKLQAKAQDLEAKLRGVGAAGKKTGDDMDAGIGKALSGITSLAAGFLSINAAMSAGKQWWDVWLRNIREVGDEAKRANSELVTLAAMQGGGQKAGAVQAAARLGASYGITNRALAFDTVQGLQASRGDDFAAGMRAAQQVFAATRVGISLEQAREAEIIGASLGVEPGASVRRAYITGKISPRSPEEVIKASPGLRFWGNNIDAWAAAGVLSGGVNPEELETYVKAGGIGLSGIEDAGFQKFLKKKGFAGGGQVDTLRFLASIGVDTPEEFSKAGIGEMRRQQAMSILVRNLPEFERYRGEIARQDVPGLFERERGGIEAELPGVRMAREIDMLQAQFANEKAFGGTAQQAMSVEQQQRIKGLALQRLGQTQLGPIDLIDEQGRFEPGWFGWKELALQFAGGFGLASSDRAVTDEEMRITRQVNQPFTEGGPAENPMAKAVVDGITRSMTEVFTKLDFTGTVRRMTDTIGRMRGGPTLVPANEDR